MKKSLIHELPVVRALAIIGVLAVHATSFATLQAKTSSYYFVYNFVNIFFKYGTPTFIMLSSFVLFYNYSDIKLWGSGKLKSFYRNRAKYILLPYAIASVCYFLMLQFLYYRSRPWDEAISVFITKLLTGSAYTHLYFVFISLQFYILFPLLLLLCRRKGIRPWIIPLGFAIQWAFVLWNKYDLQYVNKGSISLSYMSMYAVGAYLGIHYAELRNWLVSLGNREVLRKHPSYRWWNILLWFCWLAVAIAHVQLWLYTRTTGKEVNSLWYEGLWNVHTALAALVLMQLGHYLYRKLSNRTLSWFIRLGELSFAIYLLHPVFLAIYREFQWHNGNSILYPLFIAGGYVFALTCSWIVISLAFRYIPWAWIALGAKPRGQKPVTDMPKEVPALSESGKGSSLNG